MPDKDRVLVNRTTIKDCRVDTFRAGGPGGQSQNKTDSGARITHLASGAVGESRSEKSQRQNKKLAFRKMAESEKYQRWARRLSFDFDEKVKKEVERQMSPDFLDIEYFDSDADL